MRTLTDTYNKSGCLRSTAGTWGQIQIATTPDSVVLDIATRNYDTQGHLHRDYALANLSIDTAIRLRALLGEAIESALDASAAERQPGLWSDATMRAGWPNKSDEFPQARGSIR